MPVNPLTGNPGLTGNTGMDLGLGSALGQQTADESEEEKRKRRLGLSTLAAGTQSVMSLYPGLGGGLPGLGGVGRGRGY